MFLMPAFKIGLCNAWLFMSVFLLQMLVIMFVKKTIREKSHVPPEAKQTKMDKYTGILANFVWFTALVYSVFLPLLTGTVWFYAGLVLFMIGLIFLITSTCNFITTPADRVISKGVYKISRHPMYLATFFIVLGSGLASGSWLFVFLSVIMALCFHMEALIEERYCLEMYGKEYREYMNLVPRWLGFNRKRKILKK